MDSNHWPFGCKPSALTNWAKRPSTIVRPLGFEPRTPCLRGRCSNQLSYRPSVPRKGIPEYFVSGYISRVPLGLDVQTLTYGSSAITQKILPHLPMAGWVICAEERTWTSTDCSTRPSSVRVYHFATSATTLFVKYSRIIQQTWQIEWRRRACE